MFDTSAIKQNFGDAAPQYDAHADLQRTVRRHCLKLAAQRWGAGAHVLDVGCGTGAFAVESTKQAWRVTQLDMAYGMCKHAAQYGHAFNADAESLPFTDSVFDGLFSSLMLQWSNTPVRVFSEMSRVLKPHGSIILSTLTDGTLLELKETFAAVDNVPHVSNFLSVHSVLKAADQNGLSLTSAQRVPLVEYYPDTIALMRNLQAIGASNKEAARKRGLSTPRQFARLESLYKQCYGTQKGLPATWQVLFLVLGKD